MKAALGTFLVLLCIPAFADYRPNYGGWAHERDCEGSENSSCRPHHHVLNDIGVKIATEKVIHKPFIEYVNTVGLPYGVDRWDLRSKIISSFIRYFSENRLELLKLTTKEFGNAVGGCLHQPPFESYQLEYSQEECERFKSGTPKPQTDPNRSRLPRPRIEDFIEEYLGHEKDII
ncbi:MAG: hypothetical protein ACOH5I_15070 [Oligoflexus sp.]